MIVDSKTMFSKDGSYVVFSNTILHTDKFGPYTFIVHMEGTPKQLFRLWKEHRDEIQGRLLYCIKDKDFFKNHSTEIEEDLYEYTAGKY